MVAAEPIMFPFFSAGRVSRSHCLAGGASIAALSRQDERPWPGQLAAWRAPWETNFGNFPVKKAGGCRRLEKKRHAWRLRAANQPSLAERPNWGGQRNSKIQEYYRINKYRASCCMKYGREQNLILLHEGTPRFVEGCVEIGETC